MHGMQLYSTVIRLQVPRLMVSGHHLQQEVLLPGRDLPRRHCGNDRGRDQRPDQSAQRGMMTTRPACTMAGVKLRDWCFCYGRFLLFLGFGHSSLAFLQNMTELYPAKRSLRLSQVPQFRHENWKGKRKEIDGWVYCLQREGNTLKCNLLFNPKHEQLRKLTGGEITEKQTSSNTQHAQRFLFDTIDSGYFRYFFRASHI